MRNLSEFFRLVPLNGKKYQIDRFVALRILHTLYFLVFFFIGKYGQENSNNFLLFDPLNFEHFPSEKEIKNKNGPLRLNFEFLFSQEI